MKNRVYDMECCECNDNSEISTFGLVVMFAVVN